jgi:predicted RNase H-like HicB family nuclease
MPKLSYNQNGHAMQEHRYTVLFEPVPEGGYHVIVPALPETVTFGETLEEDREMALDAIRCVLESIMKDNEPIPDDTLAPAYRETLAVTLL